MKLVPSKKLGLLCAIGLCSPITIAKPLNLACAEASCLETIQVTTTTKTERKLQDVPVRTELVSAEQVEKIHAKDLHEALQYVPGLQLRPIHGKTGYGVWLQGLDANRVLVLVDGHPVSASTGSAVDTTQIAVTDIERIEIVKGAVSAMYGTSAMGGVVNIITKKPSEAFSASVTASGGSWLEQNATDNPAAMRHIKAQTKVNGDKLSFGLMGDIRNADGFKVNPDAYNTQGWAGYKSNLGLQLEYRPSDSTKFWVTPRFYQEDLLNKTLEHNPPFYTRVEKKELTTTEYIGAGFSKKHHSGVDWEVRLMDERFDAESQQDKSGTTYVDQQRDTLIEQNQVSAQVNIPLGEHLLTLGAQSSTQKMSVLQTKRSSAVNEEKILEVDNEQAQANEWFAQDSWFLSDQLELLPGARLHQDDQFGDYLAPMLNGIWRQDLSSGQLNIRLGAGNGYRVPNLKERYYIFDHSHLGYKILGNDQLEPESSVSFQAGVEWLPKTGARFEFSLFRNNITNLIETDQDEAASAAENLLIYRYRNFEKALTQGLELSWVDSITNHLKLDAAYTFMHAEDLNSGKTLPNRPEHQVKLGVDWTTPINGLGVLLKASFQSEQFENSSNTNTTPAFTTWDFKANYQLDRHWLFFAGIDNLTNIQKDFTVADSRPEEPRYVYLGLRWNYSK